jgi:hypothetical protein
MAVNLLRSSADARSQVSKFETWADRETPRTGNARGDGGQGSRPEISFKLRIPQIEVDPDPAKEPTPGAMSRSLPGSIATKSG